jgi:hypothetical protein
MQHVAHMSCTLQQCTALICYTATFANACVNRYSIPLTLDEIRAVAHSGVLPVSVVYFEGGRVPLLDAVKVYTRNRDEALRLGTRLLPL